MEKHQTSFLHGIQDYKEIWKRVLHTVLNKLWKWLIDNSDFSFSVRNIRAVGQNRLLLDIFMSSAGKVICVVNSSALLPEDLLFQETKTNRFYFRSNTTSVQEYAVDFIPAVEQRLFCKAVNLLSIEPQVLFYQSDPFYITCTF